MYKINHRRFLDLCKQPTLVRASAVCLTQCGDIHPSKFPPKIKTSLVWFDQCDKNFISYWANQSIFQGVNTLLMNSHPCDPSYMRELLKIAPIVYYSNVWQQYEHWDTDHKITWVDNNNLVHCPWDDLPDEKVDRIIRQVDDYPL